ncbi:hypothetical protein NLM27_04010 [Bradyrhizobium sp. CCGB12]|nr:hypothetical protein [Bradyrhizobium sp. CCGB12]
MALSVIERELSSVDSPGTWRRNYFQSVSSSENDAFIKTCAAFRRKGEASMMDEPKHAGDDRADHQRDDRLSVRTNIP